MKRFFNEYSSVIIICIVVSIISCVFGSVKNVNESDGKVEGAGLVANVANTMTDTIDTYQKQIFPNENLFNVSKSNIILNETAQGGPEYIGYDITALAKKYAATDKKISISAEVKLSKSGKLLFYSLGNWYINNRKRVQSNLQKDKWTQIKLENINVGYNNERTDAEFCNLSFYCGYGSGIIPQVRNIKIEEGPKCTPYVEYN